jgi:hypothetical protein
MGPASAVRCCMSVKRFTNHSFVDLPAIDAGPETLWMMVRPSSR